MYLIQGISSAPYQTQNLILPDGSSFTLTIYYRSMQYGWFIQELDYKTFTLQGFRISNSPNMLHQWRNKLPFGLGCFSQNSREPTQAQDFASGASSLYVLSTAEVASYAAYLTGLPLV